MSGNGDGAAGGEPPAGSSLRARLRDSAAGDGPVRVLGRAAGALLVIAVIVLASALLFAAGLALLAVLWRVIAWGFALAP